MITKFLQMVRQGDRRVETLVQIDCPQCYGYWYIDSDDGRICESRNRVEHPTLLFAYVDRNGIARDQIKWQEPTEDLAYTSGDTLMPEPVTLEYGESFADKFDQSMCYGYGD